MLRTMSLSMFTLLGTAIFFFGCSNSESPNRYELVASTQGYVYRLDKKTGDVSVIEQDTIRKVSDGDKVWRQQPDGTWSLSEWKIKDLVVGSLFKTEDGNIIRYVGKGKFEEKPPIEGEVRTWEDLKKKRGW
jgi:hypothetical protein